MSARYAVYYTPPSGSPLAERAAAWLGRDAFSGGVRRRPVLPALEGLDLDALTDDPRGYGFHATLKAPFELAQDIDEAGLLAFAGDFAKARPPFCADLALASLGRFLALRLASPSAEMDALHGACVREFDRFRAPISAYDLERRRKSNLSAAQDARLVEWGYPHVFDDFRFHMTLTGSMTDALLAQKVLAALADHFADVAGRHEFDGVAIFRQPYRGAEFQVLGRFAFAG